MSRIGKKKNKLESGVELKQQGSEVLVKGPKGQLAVQLTNGFTVVVEEGFAFVKPPSAELTKGKDKALYGLYGSLIQNAITGVAKGFTKKLNLVGVGYKSQVQGNKLVMALGYSHPIEYIIPAELSVKCLDQTTIEITGISKQLVGQFCAEVISARPPEPYKGKGILYEGQKIRRKEGKSGGKK
jgi:large subunit ribosomal protein L6